jgi:hypothetical protein
MSYEHNLLLHPVEAVAVFQIPVDHTQPRALFNASNMATARAREIFQHVEEALLLAKSGMLELGPQTLSGGFIRHGTTTPHPSGPFPLASTELSRAEEKRLLEVFRSLSHSTRGDKVLPRAVHRFSIGRKRRTLDDRIVDFVVACEALFLTEGGNAIDQELSYRFSLNGSSLLHHASPAVARAQAFQQMKAAYSVRSSLVHGGDSSRVSKELAKGKFSDVGKLSEFLESSFRGCVVWLASRAPARRPYLQSGGWHRLLWSHTR